MRFLALLSLALTACSFTGQGQDPADQPALDATPTTTTTDAAAVDPPPIDALGACPEGDDDQDGICNLADDWPCGARPESPADSKVIRKNDDATELGLSNIRLDDGDQLVVVNRQASVSLKLSYTIRDEACPGNCIDQIEYGLAETRVGCAFDAIVSKEDGAEGNASVAFTAPAVTAPTQFELRATIAQNYSCYAGTQTWYGGTAPDSTHTIAYVCVR